MRSKLIECSNGQYAIVDQEDYEWLREYKWHYRADQRIVRTVRLGKGSWKKKRMHIDIWERHFGDIPEGYRIDHKNWNPSDNRKDNLRLASDAESVLYRRKQKGPGGKPPSSSYKGVCWRKDRELWKAGITFKQRHLSLGHFEVETDAARAYDEALFQLYEGSEFCAYNFPDWDHTRKIFYDASKDSRLEGKPRHSSGIKGVTWFAQSKKWKAQITVDGRQKYLGLFETKEEAHQAYLDAKANQG